MSHPANLGHSTSAATAELVDAGDWLARKLGSAPGFDPMRDVALAEWQAAKVRAAHGQENADA